MEMRLEQIIKDGICQALGNLKGGWSSIIMIFLISEVIFIGLHRQLMKGEVGTPKTEIMQGLRGLTLVEIHILMRIVQYLGIMATFNVINPSVSEPSTEWIDGIGTDVMKE